jgi:hypothetical protein
VKELAKRLGISVAYIYAAEKASEDFAKRMSILHGDEPLVPIGNGKPITRKALRAFRSLSDAEKLEAAREIGASVLWDKMINPLV